MATTTVDRVPRPPLPESTPAAEGVDARGVLTFLDALENRPGLEPHGLTVARHGRIVARGGWAPYPLERPRLLYSLSKSFTATAVGVAVAEGRLGLDDLVLDHLPEFAGDAADARVRSWRIRHLLAMSSGHDHDTADQIFGTGEDPLRAFVRLAPEAEPGTLFHYNQGCTYTLAAIVQRLAGTTLDAYLRPRLFAPLGVGPVGWLQSPRGRSLGFSGLHAAHDDIVRLGQLYLQRGRWDDRQLLPAAWVDEASRRHVGTDHEPNPDWQQGYGFQFWIGRHGFRGDGAYGQFCVVLPEHDTLVVVTAATVGMQAVLDALYAHVLPALGDGPTAGVDDDALAARLAALTLPLPAGARSPDDPERWNGELLRPRGGECRVQPSLTGVRVGHDADGYRLDLVEGEVTTHVRLEGSWQLQQATVTPGEPVTVAAAGGFLDDGTLRAQVRFVDTPHTLTVIADPAAGEFRALWPTIPLHPGPLHRLRAPAVR